MNTHAPKWLDNAIFYEIYPQSFLDTDGDGIGNIRGVTEKLDYIRTLGCNAVWLTPCFASPFTDAGYDVADYCRVAERYGTNEDLAVLFAEAHKRDMHVILDLVPGHTSVQHPWFRSSMRPEPNEMTDRYIWTDSIWESVDCLPCLRGISQRDGSVAVNFFSTQPALNYGFYRPEKPWQQAMDAPGPMATREAIKDVMRFWLKMGCDGFRVDMAGSLVKNDPDGLGTISLWQDFRAFLDEEFPDAAMISEWGEPDKSLLGGFHMDFLLQFGPSHYNDLFRCDEPFFSRRGKGSAKEFIETYNKNVKKTDGKGLICIPSGNHDMDRMARHLDDNEMRIAFAFLLTMPGAPFIYYGDEIGLRHVENLTSVEGGYGRTGARSPMQWTTGLNAGFSSAPTDMLYIAQDPAPDRPDVESQMADSTSLWHEVQRLIRFRLAHSALQSNGTVTFLTDTLPLCYLRRDESETILAVINPAAEPTSVQLNGITPTKLCCSVGGSAEADGNAIRIDGASAAFFVV